MAQEKKTYPAEFERRMVELVRALPSDTGASELEPQAGISGHGGPNSHRSAYLQRIGGGECRRGGCLRIAPATDAGDSHTWRRKETGS